LASGQNRAKHITSYIIGKRLAHARIFPLCKALDVFNSHYYHHHLEATLKFLFIVVLFFSNSIYADEFNWNEKSITTSEVTLISNSKAITVTLGSNCNSHGSRCENAAKYITKDLKEIEFFRTISNGKAGLKIEKNIILISLVYLPIGSEEVINVTKYFEWNVNSQELHERNL
jgi:hypothetical protein